MKIGFLKVILPNTGGLWDTGDVLLLALVVVLCVWSSWDKSFIVNSSFVTFLSRFISRIFSGAPLGLSLCLWLAQPPSCGCSALGVSLLWHYLYFGPNNSLLVASCLCFVGFWHLKPSLPVVIPKMSSDITRMLPAGQNPLVENHCFSQKVVTLSFEVLAVHAAPQMSEAELTAKPQPPPKSTTSPLMPTTFPDFHFPPQIAYVSLLFSNFK